MKIINMPDSESEGRKKSEKVFLITEEEEETVEASPGKREKAFPTFHKSREEIYSETVLRCFRKVCVYPVCLVARRCEFY